MGSYRLGSALTHAAVTVTFCLATVGFCAASATTPAADARSTWEKLSLGQTTLVGTTVYYEKCLEPNLPRFERELAQFAAGREGLATLLARRAEVVADINRLLGATDGNPEDQARTFLQLAGMFSRTKLTIYLVTQTTIKDFLRSGGQLPNFRYERSSDTVTYSPQLHVPPGAQPPEIYDLCIPVAPNQPFDQQIAVVSEFGQFLGSGMAGVALHEVTEMTLLQRARPTDPYWRWFSDGVANALTRTLLEKHVGREVAAQFTHAYDPNACRHLARQTNLRYWMLANYGVYVSQIPVSAESKLQHARYTFSMLEAQRLIDRHGLDCLRPILDRIVARDQRDGDDLVQVIKDVTGEDLDPRLQQYQDFTKPHEAAAQYVAACQAASEKNDWETMFVNLLRIMELRGDFFSQGYLQSFVEAAVLLFRMGHEEAADQAMQNCQALFSRDSVTGGRQAALEAFVRYALNCNKPRKAQKMADELLAKAPDDVPALAVKMFISAEDGNQPQAQDYAKRVLALAKPSSAAYRAATKVLGTDPNAPTQRNAPTGPK